MGKTTDPGSLVLVLLPATSTVLVVLYTRTGLLVANMWFMVWSIVGAS